MDWILELDVIDHLLIAFKLIIILVDFTIICSIPMMPKVINTYTKKFIQKHGVVPSVNYLPDYKKPVVSDTPDELPEATKESNSLEDDMALIRADKTKAYEMLSIDKLRLRARDIGKTGFKIKNYYKMDKHTLIESIIQTEEYVAIEMANEEATELADKAKENISDEAVN